VVCGLIWTRRSLRGCLNPRHRVRAAGSESVILTRQFRRMGVKTMKIGDFEQTHDRTKQHPDHEQDLYICGACGAMYCESGDGEELEIIDYGDGTCVDKRQTD
jgi:hypothetical protein